IAEHVRQMETGFDLQESLSHGFEWARKIRPYARHLVAQVEQIGDLRLARDALSWRGRHHDAPARVASHDGFDFSQLLCVRDAGSAILTDDGFHGSSRLGRRSTLSAAPLQLLQPRSLFSLPAVAPLRWQYGWTSAFRAVRDRQA